MSAETMDRVDQFKVPAAWTDDCQGKKDFDGELVSLSTRYWPAGGGFSAIIPGRGWVDNPADCKPSANSKIILRHGDDYVIFAQQAFEADSLELVKQQVEVWAQKQYERVIYALTKEFGLWQRPPSAAQNDILNAMRDKGVRVRVEGEDALYIKVIDAYEIATTALSPLGTLDMSPDARLKDAEDDVLRLHKEKMKFFERVIELEREVARLSASAAPMPDTVAMIAYNNMADVLCRVADAAREAFIKAGFDPGEWDGDNIEDDVTRGLVMAIEQLAAQRTERGEKG